MQAVQKDLMGMLVRELKEELETRDQPKTGNKACWLRRRLHGAIHGHGAILLARTYLGAGLAPLYPLCIAVWLFWCTFSRFSLPL